MAAKSVFDNLMIGYPYLNGSAGQFEFSQACHAIAEHQIEMSTRGYFMRGAIGIGDLHISDTMVYGNIFDEMAAADKPGSPPRLILLEPAIRHLEEVRPIHVERLIDTDNGQKYLNYLGNLGVRPERWQSVRDHKLSIEEQLRSLEKNDENADVLLKYQWLAAYHNRFCESSGHFNADEFLIDDPGRA